MTAPTSQQYAELANDAYRNARPGTEVEFGGVTFRVREHVNHSGRGESGYAGTIYQRTDTGEMVVAHRGTEFELSRNGLQDLLLTDAGMVANRRTNGQGDEAVALTRRAIELAGGDASKVTVTGHSLGGTLAQISAAETGVRGETFNAYGAVGLERRGIREGGDSVVNHVMAADSVSAASRHFGEVRTYATDQEVDRMGSRLFGGYSNNPVPIVGSLDDKPFIVAGRSFGSHMMHNFLDVDGNGNRDRSVIGDPRATELARDNATMIDTYRGDIQGAHTVARTGGDISRYLRDFREIGRDIFGAVEPDTSGPATRTAALEGNGTSQMLDRMLSGDRGALQAAADLPAGRELSQNVVAIADREQLQAAQRLVEQSRVAEPDTVRSAGGRAV